MTLLELLVKELPQRGGWPEGAKACYQSEVDFELYFDGDCKWRSYIFLAKAEDNESAEITRDQYEAALAESQQPAWSGEGLPPVGVECEFATVANYKENFVRAKVIAYGETSVFMQHWASKNEFIHSLNKIKFRPIRTEADRKRENFATSLCEHLDDLMDWYNPVAKVHSLAIYDAIAAGKIPGVTLS